LLSLEKRLEGSNHYEFLQISAHAEPETIQRVFKFLASRLHPDNPETGDAEKFSKLKTAYDVLSDPARRAAYDAERERTDGATIVQFTHSMDFMDSMEGELNRRLAVLAVLYIRRRTSPNHPEVSLSQVEARMGFPRDYLEFTLWYLLKKNYITRADNSALTLTAEGVDFVETQRVTLPKLNRLLTSGSEAAVTNGRNGAGESAPTIGTAIERRSGRDRRKTR
jgi:curved DNA-binding protein CbpA